MNPEIKAIQELKMNQFSDQDLIVAGCVAAGVVLVLTPLFGIWGWIALLFGAWLTVRCLGVIDSFLR
ncbi:MAG: hypothetical protein C0483_04705 [Pirellula sp.]|nr:hypothetical protein [Pirellula sp.]